MKIAYIHTDSDSERHECFSIKPSKYGGHIAPRFLKEKLNSDGNIFHLYADARCFQNLTEEDNKSACFPIDAESRIAINKGEPIIKFIPNAADYDIICHGNCFEWLNTEGIKAKTATWCLGAYEQVHPLNKNLLFFNFEGQKPQLKHNDYRKYDIIIGSELPIFKKYIRDNFLFLCSRLNNIMGVPILIQLCIKNNIPLVLGGKIDKGFEFIDQFHIKNSHNNSCIKYYGELKQENKINFTQKCRAVCFPLQWQSPFSLLSVEAQHFGTPLITTKFGWFPQYITNGYNGYLIDTEEEFVTAYNNCQNIKEIDCYNAAKDYNADRMCETFLEAFKQILNN